MTESEWLTCEDPSQMLEAIRREASPRKLRLFACACVRRVWSLLADESSQRAVEVAERYADGKANATELSLCEIAAFEVASQADLGTTVSDPGWAARRAASRAANLDAYTAASGTAFGSLLCAAPWMFDADGAVVHRGDPVAKQQARAEQCRLLREILGNPFQNLQLDPRWQTWNRGIVLHLAKQIYEARRFQELPVLADALEEAGCSAQPLLRHLREATSHVPGCWALDLILGQI